MHNLFLSMLWVASTALGLPAAAPTPDGQETAKIIYPKEIENCEPCKRLWLANNQKPGKDTPASPQAKAQVKPATKAPEIRAPDL